MIDEWIVSDDISELNGQKKTIDLTPRLVLRPSESVNTPQNGVTSPEEEIVKRGRGRPHLLRTKSRGRLLKLFQSQVRSQKTTPSGKLDANDEIGNKGELEDDVFANVADISVKEALDIDVSDEWLKAIESEVTSLVKNDTLDIIKRDDEENVIGCHLVFTNKYDASGEIAKCKARLVAKGYSQRYGVDLHQTFAPVARLETLRLMLALSA